MADGLQGLESSIHTIQRQLDTSNRKVSTTETILKNITQERDSAVSQLGVAYFTIEQLKVENEALKDENKKMSIRLGQLTDDHENETQKWTATEQNLRRKLDRRTEEVRNMIEESRVQPPEAHDKSGFKDRHSERVQPIIEPPTHRDTNNMFDLMGQKNTDEASKGGQRITQIDDSQDSEESAYEATKGKGKGKAQSSRNTKNSHVDETSQNLTYLSFLEVGNHLIISLNPLTM